jgi:FkbM family methyltransferase
VLGFAVKRLPVDWIRALSYSLDDHPDTKELVQYRNPLGMFDRLAAAFLANLRPAGFASALKSVLHRNRVRIETPNGRFLIDPFSHFGRELAMQGDYEPQMRKTIVHYLKPGDTFVDLGANEGFFSVQAAAICGPGGRVVAIEPQNRLLDVLRENLRLNEIRCAEVISVAVSDKPGTAMLYLAPDINTGGSGLSNAARYPVRAQPTSLRTLSQVLDENRIDHVDFMKVDIEGFEWEMLTGAPEVFATHRIRAMAMEIHESLLQRRGLDAGEILRKLETFGYRIETPYGHWVWLA